jgi:hypothetical protein
MDRSSVVARVTVKRPHAKLPDALASDPDRLAVARLDRVISENKQFLSSFQGEEVTLLLERGEVAAGDQLVFFGNVASAGKTIMLAEIGSFPDTSHDADARINAARLDRDRRAIYGRATKAKWVFVGTVDSIGAPQSAPAGRISEHDPAFADAVVTTHEALLGSPPPRVHIRFASSRDVAWWRAPKLTQGEEAVFLAQPSDDADAIVLEPLDVHPLTDRAAIADVLRCPP